MVFSLSQPTGTSLNLPGPSNINRSCNSISQLPQHLSAICQAHSFQVKCTLTQYSSIKVLDFLSSLRGLEFLCACFSGSDWCKGSTEYLSLLHVTGHWPPCPIWQQVHLCRSCSWRIPPWCSAWRLRNKPTASGYSGSSGHLPFATLTNAVLAFLGAIKRRLSLHRGALLRSPSWFFWPMLCAVEGNILIWFPSCFAL